MDMIIILQFVALVFGVKELCNYIYDRYIVNLN